MKQEMSYLRASRIRIDSKEGDEKRFKDSKRLQLLAKYGNASISTGFGSKQS